MDQGKQAYLEGRLKSRTYQTQTGETRFSNDITITEVQYLGGQRDGTGDPVGAAAAAGHQVDEDVDLPF